MARLVTFGTVASTSVVLAACIFFTSSPDDYTSAASEAGPSCTSSAECGEDAGPGDASAVNDGDVD